MQHKTKHSTYSGHGDTCKRARSHERRQLEHPIETNTIEAEIMKLHGKHINDENHKRRGGKYKKDSLEGKERSLKLKLKASVV